MQQPISYAQALTEAKQMIVQQQLRIKADAEKLRTQEKTISEQSSSLADRDRRLQEQMASIAGLEGQLQEQAAELTRLVEESAALGNRCQELTTAKEQAEAIIDRQGNRLTQMQTQLAEMEQLIAGQKTSIESLTNDLQAARQQLPTDADKEALFSMAELLAKRPPAMASKKSVSPMRIASDDDATPMAVAA